MNDRPHRFARHVFTAAWIWGLLSLVPLYFLEGPIGRASGAPVLHPEYFYGFVGTALVFQAVFFLVSRDPARYRPLIPVGVAEKAAFALPALLLVLGGRAPASLLPFAGIDAALGVLFAAAYLKSAAADARA